MDARNKFTPGPWAITAVNRLPVAKSLGVINPKSTVLNYEIKGAQVAVVANIKECNLRSDAQTEANARLIAAAPEMLEALRGVADIIRENLPSTNAGIEALDRVEAAIAKATNGDI